MANTTQQVKAAVEYHGATLRHVDEQELFRSTCGFRRDLKVTGDINEVSFHYLKIHESKKHYHTKITEHYFVVEGEGEIELDDKSFPIKKGDLVVIPPQVRHTSHGLPGKELEVLIVVYPAPILAGGVKDEFFD